LGRPETQNIIGLKPQHGKCRAIKIADTMEKSEATVVVGIAGYRFM